MISLREKIDAGARVGSQTRVPNLKSTEFRGMIGGLKIRSIISSPVKPKQPCQPAAMPSSVSDGLGGCVLVPTTDIEVCDGY